MFYVSPTVPADVDCVSQSPVALQFNLADESNTNQLLAIMWIFLFWVTLRANNKADNTFCLCVPEIDYEMTKGYVWRDSLQCTYIMTIGTNPRKSKWMTFCWVDDQTNWINSWFIRGVHQILTWHFGKGQCFHVILEWVQTPTGGSARARRPCRTSPEDMSFSDGGLKKGPATRDLHNSFVIVLVVWDFNKKYIAILIINNTIYGNFLNPQYNILVLLDQPKQYSVNNILQYIILFYPWFHSPQSACNKKTTQQYIDSVWPLQYNILYCKNHQYNILVLLY